MKKITFVAISVLSLFATAIPANSQAQVVSPHEGDTTVACNVDLDAPDGLCLVRANYMESSYAGYLLFMVVQVKVGGEKNQLPGSEYNFLIRKIDEGTESHFFGDQPDPQLSTMTGIKVDDLGCGLNLISVVTSSGQSGGLVYQKECPPPTDR